MNGHEEFASMKNAVRFIDILIESENEDLTREDQMNLFVDEFHNSEALFTAILDTFINFVGTIALGTSVQEMRPVSNAEVLTAFRNGIASIINESN